MHLREACAEVMDDAAIKAKYPDGLTSGDVLAEIRVKHPGAYPLCSILDVHDELSALYGKPSANPAAMAERRRAG